MRPIIRDRRVFRLPATANRGPPDRHWTKMHRCLLPVEKQHNERSAVGASPARCSWEGNKNETAAFKTHAGRGPCGGSDSHLLRRGPSLTTSPRATRPCQARRPAVPGQGGIRCQRAGDRGPRFRNQCCRRVPQPDQGGSRKGRSRVRRQARPRSRLAGWHELEGGNGGAEARGTSPAAVVPIPAGPQRRETAL